MFNFKLSLQALGSRSGASGGFVPSVIYQQGLFPLMLTDWPPVVPLPTSSSSLSFFDFSNQLFSLSSSLSLSSFSSFVSRHFLLYFLSISCSLIYLFAFFFCSHTFQRVLILLPLKSLLLGALEGTCTFVHTGGPPSKGQSFLSGCWKITWYTDTGGWGEWMVAVCGWGEGGGVGGWGSHLYNRCMFACVFACVCVSQTQV